MLSTPLICCSSGVATDCSTVCASAPTYVVCTCTSGGAIDGKSDTGRLTIVIAPTRTVSSENTIATIGRLMKNFDMSALRWRSRALDHVHGRALAHLHQTFGDHPFAGLHAGGDDPQIPDALAERHRADRDEVVVADDRDLIVALQLRHGALRDQQRVRHRRGGESDAAVAAGAEDVVWIREDAGDADRSGARADFAVGKRNRSGVFVDAAIAKQQLKRHALALLVDAALGRKAAMKVDEHLLADGEIGLDRIDL